MNVIELIIFILATIGLGHILVEGTILLPFKNKLDKWSEVYKISTKIWRDNFSIFRISAKSSLGWLFGWFCSKLLELLSCYQCTGFWAGLIVSLLMGLSDCLIYGFAGSFLCPLGAIMLMYFNVSAVSNSK
jgi:hypothetical protein